MKQSAAYDQTLRAIGQALEGHGLNAFDLKSSGDNYLVRGEPGKINALQMLLRKWQSRYRRDNDSSGIRYTPQDIDRLERQGRARRGGPQRLPDFYSLSNILRTIGAYLDMKDAYLLQVYKQDLKVMILYQTSEGHPKAEERTIASFYNLSLEMYQKRQKRNPS